MGAELVEDALETQHLLEGRRIVDGVGEARADRRAIEDERAQRRTFSGDSQIGGEAHHGGQRSRACVDHLDE